ncbi:MAG: segregation and condensation protein A [Desulfitobacteriia bacterium]|jgi:segregation and condensation protein A
MPDGIKTPYVELPVFQGPLDLLLHLIQQNKVDIYDIPIATIADQFMATVRKMEELDLEVTTEFLVLAAQLLFLKSRQLLPRPQKSEQELELEEELKQDLAAKLLTYKAFKEAADYLGSKAESSGSKYFREVDLEALLSKMKPSNPLSGVQIEDLLQVLKQIIARIDESREIHYVETEDISIELLARDILRRMVFSPQGIKFDQLLHYQSRVEIVAAFLAVLELLKQGKIRAEQNNKTKEIFMVPTARAWEFENEVSV